MSDEWGKVMRLEAEGRDGSILMINYIYIPGKRIFSWFGGIAICNFAL